MGLQTVRQFAPLRMNHDLHRVVWLEDGAPRALDTESGGVSDLLAKATPHPPPPPSPPGWGAWRPPPYALSNFFDEDSSIEVDWRARRLFWCQPSARRILTAHIDGGPLLTLVNDSLCSGLAVDVLQHYLYWTSPTGHALFGVSYAEYNGTYADDNPLEPLYSLCRKESGAVRGNATLVTTVVSGSGLVGDFGKDPHIPPLLLTAVAADPDDGDAAFGTGDTITIKFDRALNVSQTMIGYPRDMSYVDSLFTVSEPLGSEYEGQWTDASTFRIEINDGWLPQPQINATRTLTTRAVSYTHLTLPTICSV